VPTSTALVTTPGVTSKVVGSLLRAIETVGTTVIPAEIAETAIEAESGTEVEIGAEVAETEEVARVVIGEVDHGGGVAHAAGGGATPDEDHESARTGGARRQIADALQDIGTAGVAGRRRGDIEAPRGDGEAPQADRQSEQRMEEPLGPSLDGVKFVMACPAASATLHLRRSTNPPQHRPRRCLQHQPRLRLLEKRFLPCLLRAPRRRQRQRQHYRHPDHFRA